MANRKMIAYFLMLVPEISLVTMQTWGEKYLSRLIELSSAFFVVLPVQGIAQRSGHLDSNQTHVKKSSIPHSTGSRTLCRYATQLQLLGLPANSQKLMFIQ